MRTLNNLILLRTFSVILILIGFTACGTKTISPRVTQRVPPTGIYHVVQSGENLFRIGLIYNVTVDTLVRANRLNNPGQLEIGQRIFIPGSTSKTAHDRGRQERGVRYRPRAPEVADRITAKLLWPINGSISSGFGPRGASFHDGIDISAPAATPIHAVADGEVLYSDELRGYGNIVILRHSDGLVSVYAHNEVNLVGKGEQVTRGQVIARVGSTGRVTGPHLHFEIRYNNTPRDPLPYLPQLCCVEASDMVTPRG